jgi:hypothetical protein
VFLGHRHVHEEHLVEMPVPVHEHERAHGDAGRFHVDQQVADAPVLGRSGIRAHEEIDPVRELGARGPDLLTVDEEVVALVHRARLEPGQVRSRARLGEALAPDVLGGENARHEARLLRRRPHFDQGGSDHADARIARQHRRPHAEALLVVDELLHQGRPAPAVFLGPGDPDPARLVHDALPGHPALEGIAIGRHPLVGGIVHAELRRQIGREPAA